MVFATNDNTKRELEGAMIQTLRFSVTFLVLVAGCSPNAEIGEFQPTRVVDLGALVTTDLPQQIWGTAFLEQMGFEGRNSFDVMAWEFAMGDRIVNGSNANYTLFNHGGPHVDAPNHMGLGGGIDSNAIEDFSGPVRVFDVRGHDNGRTIPMDIFNGHVSAGDVVLIYTGFQPPQDDDAFPEHATLTNEAADYLASLPIRAFGTDAFSIDSLQDISSPSIHDSFLGSAIPAYEQLRNINELNAEDRMYFVGVPLNIKDGDGMIVRPVVFVY